MFPFFKRNKNEVLVPEWASFFSKVEYQVFIEAIDKFFYKKNITYTLEDDGALNAGPNDFDFGILGLMNIAQVCKQNELLEYANLINAHFDSLIKTNQFRINFKEIIEDYNQIEQYIAVRLYPKDYLEIGGKENKVYKMIAGEIAEVLVFDLPDAVQTIDFKEAEKWNKTIDELFKRGVENIRDKYLFDISVEKIGEVDILFVQGDLFLRRILYSISTTKILPEAMERLLVYLTGMLHSYIL